MSKIVTGLISRKVGQSARNHSVSAIMDSNNRPDLHVGFSSPEPLYPNEFRYVLP